MLRNSPEQDFITNNDKNNKNIRIKYLRSAINGGILYSADRLIHVVDDNDQLVAIYDDQSSSIHGIINNQQEHVDHSVKVAGQSGKAGHDLDDPSKRVSTDSLLSMTEISHENNVCNIQIKSTSLSGQRSKKLNYANQNKFSDDPCLASNSVEVKNLNDIPASTSSLIVRRESEPAFNGQLPRRPTIVTASSIKHKAPRDKSLSPVKLGVRWQAEEIPFEEDYKAPLPSSFSRGGARKSRVTDEMLDIAAQLAEKAQRNPSSSSEYLPEVNGDSANETTLNLNNSKTTVGNEISGDRTRISRSASPLLSSTSTTTISQPFLSDLQKGNTKKLGRLLTVELMKGSEGLGFTVTSRDNARAGDNFTCIKNILPRGAALKDGRLREGDRLLK
uniref:PDZ domain-containing protein n=1 Tax=Romanomermis culicivorax TaxID=13658 RepID=A0A915K4I5_ROMCU